MERIFWRTFFIVVFGITLITGQSNLSFGKNSKRQDYPIICKSEIRSMPRNIIRKVDINSDGLDDLIIKYDWGVRALYINCNNAQYYRVLRSTSGIGSNTAEKDGWHSISVNGSGIIDGQMYKCAFLPLEYKKDGKKYEFDILVEHDGISYKPPFSYIKQFQFYAPQYRFDSNVKVEERSTMQKVKAIYCELTKNNKCQVELDDQEAYKFEGVYFSDLNRDGSLDAIVHYRDRGGSGDGESNAGLLLNDGSNNFVYAGEIIIGHYEKSFPLFKSKSISINGIKFIAIEYKGGVLRPGQERPIPESAVYLYVYQPKLKEFICLIAVPSPDKFSYIPLDKKEFEDIVNPPLFRDEPSYLGNSTIKLNVDEPAITKLIDNYEKSLVNAINSGKFSLVEKYLTPGSNLYKSQKNLVANLYKKGTKEKLVDFKVKNIKTTAKPNVYQVYVYEKIGIKRADKADFTVSEFKWVYTVVFDGTKYSLSDIAKWDGK